MLKRLAFLRTSPVVEGAWSLLQALPIEVLSSPLLGVEHALERLSHAG